MGTAPKGWDSEQSEEKMGTAPKGWDSEQSEEKMGTAPRGWDSEQSEENALAISVQSKLPVPGAVVPRREPTGESRSLQASHL